MKLSNHNIIYITFFTLVMTLCMGITLFAQLSESKSKSELQRTLEKEFGGKYDLSIRIEKGGQMWLQTYSSADISNNQPPKKRVPLFNIASITKSITAVAIMKLVEDGKIDLDDKISAFFDGVPESMSGITVEMLLSHQSGLPQSFPLDGILESDRALEIILNQELEFLPGENFRYSNQNYQLLALLIEQLTGQSYEDYIRQNIFLPLKMTNTLFWDEIDDVTTVAPLPNRIKRLLGKRQWGFLGASGIFSSADDLANFWNGVFKNGFLNQQSIDQIFKPYFTTSSGLEIGLGFFKSPTTPYETPELWARGTESWGHNAAIRYLPEKDLVVIVLTNSGEIEGDRLATGNKLVSDFILEYLLR